MERLPLQVEQLLQVFVAAIRIFNPLGQLTLGSFHHLFLLADLFGLLFDGIVAFVERAFSFMQLLPNFA